MPEACCSPFGAAVSLVTDKVTTRKDPSKPYVGLEHLASDTSALVSRGSASDSTSTNNVFRAGDILLGNSAPVFGSVSASISMVIARPTFWFSVRMPLSTICLPAS